MITQKFIKLSDYARNKSVTYTTAWNHFRRGLIKNAFKDESGHVLIPIVPEKTQNEQNAILYSRVSSHSMKENLNRQQNKLEEYAVSNGYNIIKSIKEVGSGTNDNRKQLLDILQRDDWSTLIIENKDRLTSFGFNYIKTLLEKNNKQIVVINHTDNDKTDLIHDLVAVIYSFSARMYGLRKRKNKDEIIKFLEN